MDLQIYALFLAVAFVTTIVGFVFERKTLGGVAAFMFIFIGLTILTNGVSTASVYRSSTNVSAFDAYNPLYNTTYNFSYTNNITSQVNRTYQESYAYNNLQDNYLNTFAILLIGIGAIIGLESFRS